MRLSIILPLTAGVLAAAGTIPLLLSRASPSGKKQHAASKTRQTHRVIHGGQAGARRVRGHATLRPARPFGMFSCLIRTV
jgi:hypothetical protein